jgi:hypothetical protein
LAALPVYTMAKLTLSVDRTVVSQAKRYAKQNGISLSRMVETYLASISAPSAAKKMAPVLRSVRGILKKADPADYKKHLAAKYR